MEEKTTRRFKSSTNHTDKHMTPQFNTQAEEIVLGTILTYPDVTAIAIQELKPEYFYQTNHQTYFKAITDLFSKNQGVDILTVYTATKDALNGYTAADVSRLQNKIGSKAHFDTHVSIVKDCWLKRELTKLSVKVQAEAGRADIDAKTIIADHLSNLYHISHETTKDKPIAEIFAAMQQSRLDRKGVRLCYKTQMDALDHSLFGLLPTDLTILAGRPGQGKTAFALNMLINLSVKQRIPTCFISLEMASEQILERVESAFTGIKHERIVNGYLIDQEKILLSEAHEVISNSPFYMSDISRIDTTSLRAKLSLYKAKYDVKVCFIDYLQLVGANGKKSDYERVSEVSMCLKAAAKEFDISIVALAQLSRQVESRADKMPQMSDLKESGQIEQDADRIIFLMRPEYYGMDTVTVNGVDESSAGKLIVKIAKNRHGHVPKPSLMKWEGDLMRVSDLVPF